MIFSSALKNTMHFGLRKYYFFPLYRRYIIMCIHRLAILSKCLNGKLFFSDAHSSACHWKRWNKNINYYMYLIFLFTIDFTICLLQRFVPWIEINNYDGCTYTYSETSEYWTFSITEFMSTTQTRRPLSREGPVCSARHYVYTRFVCQY